MKKNCEDCPIWDPFFGNDLPAAVLGNTECGANRSIDEHVGEVSGSDLVHAETRRTRRRRETNVNAVGPLS
jgi:hypothetical protein